MTTAERANWGAPREARPPRPAPRRSGRSTTDAPSPRPIAAERGRSAGGLELHFEAPPRVLGDFGPRGGGTLVVIGGIHGNEPAGVEGLLRVCDAFAHEPGGLLGRLVALTGNRRSLARGERYQVHDLNRAWRPAELERVQTSARDGADPRDEDAEDRELRELHQVISAIRSESRGPVSFLDLHSTSGRGPPFTSLDDTLANRTLAFALPVTHVLGLEEELTGTLVGHLNELGHAAIGFECGRHGDPASVGRSEAAVWLALEAARIVSPSRPEIEAARRTLSGGRADLPDVVEVVHRHPVAADDAFVMVPGLLNFQPVSSGRLLAHDRRGPITAPCDGHLLMPLYQRKGDDGFFIVRPVRPTWLTVSAALRRVGAHRLVHLLPGVRRDREQPGTVIVDRHRARWLALEIFHLLGYKRRGAAGRHLRMSRRTEPPHDLRRSSPR